MARLFKRVVFNVILSCMLWWCRHWRWRLCTYCCLSYNIHFCAQTLKQNIKSNARSIPYTKKMRLQMLDGLPWTIYVTLLPALRTNPFETLEPKPAKPEVWSMVTARQIRHLVPKTWSWAWSTLCGPKKAPLKTCVQVIVWQSATTNFWIQRWWMVTPSKSTSFFF